MLTRLEIRSIVFDEIGQQLELGGEREPLTDPARRLMDEVGLNSLMVASLLIALEDRIGVDPFARDISITDIATINDLIDAYDRTPAATVSARG